MTTNDKKKKSGAGYVIAALLGLGLIAIVPHLGNIDFDFSSGEANSSTKDSKREIVQSYQNGYSHGEENKYDVSNPYEYWKMVRASNNAGITATYILDYTDSWAEGYRDGYNRKRSKY